MVWKRGCGGSYLAALMEDVIESVWTFVFED